VLGSLAKLLGGNIVSGVNTLVETIWGSEEKDAVRRARRRQGSVGQFASEFRRLENRTWWDALVDGLNRLPRPVLVFLVLGYFALAYLDPTEFQVLNTALDGVPDEAWFLLGAIVTFYFGARELEKNRSKAMTLSRAQFADMQSRIAELRGRDTGRADDPLPHDPVPNGAALEGDIAPTPGAASGAGPAGASPESRLNGGGTAAEDPPDPASDRPRRDAVIRDWFARHRREVRGH
jgi:hypothetical protein